MFFTGGEIMLRCILSLSLLSSISAFADTSQAEVSMPWAIASVELHELPEPSSPKILIDNNCTPSKPSAMLDVSPGDIITIGEKLWSIIESGKPVVTVNVPEAFALPRGITCWSDLDHWQPPRTKSYEVVYKNYFGMEVVHFNFRLQYTFGGGKNGVGQYLANVTVMPAQLNVTWGYTFDAQLQVEEAVNLGSKENPLAGLEMNLLWDVKTVMMENNNTFHFFVQGDGTVQASQ
jgi:hypothetical protein